MFGAPPRPRKSVAERLWANVDKSGECWVWTAHVIGHGYGSMRVWVNDRWTHDYTHRISWVLAFGPIPDGLNVLHHCDNPPCVRPDHLFLGTHRQNIADKVAKGRQHRGERHPFARLTTASVLAIRTRHVGGDSVSELAAEFGVNRRTVRDAINRVTWGHVVGP